MDGSARPDVKCRSKQIVVDAKAPLAPYLESIDADDETRATRLTEHARQVPST